MIKDYTITVGATSLKKKQIRDEQRCVPVERGWRGEGEEEEDWDEEGGSGLLTIASLIQMCTDAWMIVKSTLFFLNKDTVYKDVRLKNHQYLRTL